MMKVIYTKKRPRLHQRIKVELDPLGIDTRWAYQKDPITNKYYLKDFGYSGDYAYGDVIEVSSKDIIKILVYYDVGSKNYYIAGEKSNFFQEGQWDLPGFCEVVEEVDINCTCGANKVYGINNGAHSHWCDIKQG